MSIITSRPTDLSDSEWAEIEPLLPAPRPAGCRRTINRRLALNLWMFKAWSGFGYHRLPKDFGINWRVAYDLYPHLSEIALTKLNEFARRRGRMNEIERNDLLGELRGLLQDGIPRLDDVERVLIRFALLHFRHQRRAAEALGIGVRTLYDKLRKYFPELLRFAESQASDQQDSTPSAVDMQPACEADNDFPLNQSRTWAAAEAERLVRQMKQ